MCDMNLDDLLYMERSTLSTFVDESQLAILLTLWQHREAGDNNAFMDKFVTPMEDGMLEKDLPEIGDITEDDYRLEPEWELELALSDGWDADDCTLEEWTERMDVSRDGD